MKAGIETQMYNKGYADGFDEAVKSEILKIHPKLKGSDPDYWTRLEHQYAGMAMQGILSNESIIQELDRQRLVNRGIVLSDMAICYAHALVQKLKEIRKKKTKEE